VRYCARWRRRAGPGRSWSRRSWRRCAGCRPGPERVALLLDLGEVHLLRLHDPDSAARSVERAIALAPNDALVRRRVVGLLADVREDMSHAPGFDGHAWLRGLAGSQELGDAGVACVWLTLGESCLRAQDVDGAAGAWQQVFALASPGSAALAEARQHLATLGAGGDLQAQRVALQRLLAGEDQPRSACRSSRGCGRSARRSATTSWSRRAVARRSRWPTTTPGRTSCARRRRAGCAGC
jgi:hypothetical protein